MRVYSWLKSVLTKLRRAVSIFPNRACRRRTRRTFVRTTAKVGLIFSGFLVSLDDVCGQCFDDGSPSVGLSPSSIASGDFNGDGHEDLVTANAYSNDISVLLGQGDGSFASPIQFPVGITGFGGRPVAITKDDINGDGILDLAISHETFLSVLIGNGDGTFGELQFPIGSIC